MRMILRGIGVATALVLLVISAALNARFGHGLGRSAFDAAIFATASVAVDGFKVGAVFFMAWAVASRQVLIAAASCALFVLCTGYSLTSAIGFAAVNRSAQVDDRMTSRRLHADLTDRVSAARQRLDKLGSVRFVGEIEAELQAERRDARWSSTRGCTDVTLSASRTFCLKVDRLTGERARAEGAAAARDHLRALEAQLNDLAQHTIPASDDPQAELLAVLFGAGTGDIRLALSLLMAGLVEFGSAIGLLVATHSGKPKPSKRGDARSTGEPIADAVGAFALERVVRSPGGRLSLEEVIAAFEAWWVEEGRGRNLLGVPRPAIERLMEDAGVPAVEDDDDLVFIGIGLNGDESKA